MNPLQEFQNRDWYNKEDAAEVVSNVWICNALTAWNVDFINEKGGAAVINASAMEPHSEILNAYKDLGILYYSFGSDFHDANFGAGMSRSLFMKYMHKANELISFYFRNRDIPIFVHCAAGVNRSASCIVAFLILSRGFTHKRAVLTLRRANARQRHAPALTNSDFVAALKDLDPTSISASTTDGLFCLHCGRENPKYYCSHCPYVTYCNQSCSSGHWRDHKPFCLSQKNSEEASPFSQHPQN